MIMKPLTIEQLKALEVGDWVWVIDLTRSGYATYVQKDTKSNDKYNQLSWVLFYGEYGTKWFAYKNKEQAEVKGEIVELPGPFIDTDVNSFGETTYLVYRSKVDIYCPAKDIYISKAKAERRLKELQRKVSK